jgi:hypothetical protein
MSAATRSCTLKCGPDLRLGGNTSEACLPRGAS